MKDALCARQPPDIAVGAANRWPDHSFLLSVSENSVFSLWLGACICLGPIFLSLWRDLYSRTCETT